MKTGLAARSRWPRSTGVVGALMACVIHGCLKTSPVATTRTPALPSGEPSSVTRTPASISPSAAPTAAGTPRPAPAASTPVPIASHATTAGLAGAYGTGIVSSADAGIPSNNSGSLVGTVIAPPAFLGQASAFRLTAAASQLPLPGATVHLLDGAGRQVSGPDGKPITAVTDAKGAYAFTGIAAGRNMLVAVDLGSRGLLQGIVAKGASHTDIDLVSSLTTGYIMSQYVLPQPNPATVLDRLPGDVESATRTQAAAALAAGSVAVPDALTPDRVTGTVASLRKADQGFDGQMETVRKLLLVGGSASKTDGPALQAQIGDPEGVAVDPHGNVFVAERFNHLIRMITPDGQALTVAGSGAAGKADGVGTAARLGQPLGLALDEHDPAHPGLYLNDSGFIRHVDLTDPAHAVVTTIPLPKIPLPAGISVPSPAPSGAFSPDGQAYVTVDCLAVDAKGTLYAATPLTIFVHPVGGDYQPIAGPAPGAAGAVAAPKNGISAMVVSAAGVLYTNERGSSKIWAFQPTGGIYTPSVIAGSDTNGDADGPGTTATFWTPGGLAIDGHGHLIVADTGPIWDHVHGNRIRSIDLNAADFPVTTLAGDGHEGHTDGPAAKARFYAPDAVAAADDGTVYVADSYNNLVRKVATDGTVSTIAGTGVGSSADAQGTDARLNSPNGLAADADGTVYVADQGNHTIRSISPDGNVKTIAGVAGKYGNVDGPGASAMFKYPAGIALDGRGNLYIADEGNYTIRKIVLGDPTHPVSTVAGSDPSATADGVGKAAGFQHPRGIACDALGNVYVGDFNNHEIRKIDMSDPTRPNVTTFAGSLTAGTADGVGSAAGFSGPYALAFGANGNLYVADSANRDIRQITPAGVVTRLAGGVAGLVLQDGPAGTAVLGVPTGLVTAPDGSVYVSDALFGAIRKIAPNGDVTTVSTQLESPVGLALGPHGTLYVAEINANRVRAVALP